MGRGHGEEELRELLNINSQGGALVMDGRVGRISGSIRGLVHRMRAFSAPFSLMRAKGGRGRDTSSRARGARTLARRSWRCRDSDLATTDGAIVEAKDVLDLGTCQPKRRLRTRWHLVRARPSFTFSLHGPQTPAPSAARFSASLTLPLLPHIAV